jgi:hypothetical protein
MKSLTALAVILLLAGCSSTRRVGMWEKLAAGAELADAGSTVSGLQAGGVEANPTFGSHPQVAVLISANVTLHMLIHAAIADLPEREREMTWKVLFAVRMVCAAWNVVRR